MKFICPNEIDTINLAKNIAKNIKEEQLLIFLSGDLGSGKTTFARSFIQNFGFIKVKSPTYSIVESYINKKIKIHHFDLYRISNFEELELIGVREYLADICLIEWAENIADYLPQCDIKISFSDKKNCEITIKTYNKNGEKLLKNL